MENQENSKNGRVNEVELHAHKSDNGAENETDKDSLVEREGSTTTLHIDIGLMKDEQPVKKGIELFTLCCVTICCFLPLSVSCISLGVKGSSCDHVDVSTNLNVAQWITVEGVLLIATPLLMITCLFVSSVCRCLLMVVFVLFSLSWSIVGSFVLWKANLDCIKKGEIMMTLAVLLWLFSWSQSPMILKGVEKEDVQEYTSPMEQID
jgi:hypothetical protein